VLTHPLPRKARMKLHANAKLTPSARLLLCRRIEDQGRSVTEAAEAAGVSERTARKWLARYRAEGPGGLSDRSSRPHRIARRTAPERARAVLALRRARMTAEEIAACLAMPQRTASRICARADLGRLRALDPAEPANRYETPRPGQLVHIDVKKLGRIDRAGHRVTGTRTGQRRGSGWERVHVAVDGGTRLAYVEVLADERKETACGFLERAIAWFAARGIVVERILTDNGSAYRSHLHRETCTRLGIRHSRTRAYRPRTNGKAERFIKTLTERWAYGAIYATSAERTAALASWLRFYNHQRPHSSLARQTPAARLGWLLGNNVLANHT
jgi:transposase InsO family protein